MQSLKFIESKGENNSFNFSKFLVIGDLPEHCQTLIKVNLKKIYIYCRIDQPIRREPALQISEFNLSNKTTDDGGKLIDVHELVSVLNERATHHEIKKKVKTMQQKSKPLPKPMEKLHADKVFIYKCLKKNCTSKL